MLEFRTLGAIDLKRVNGQRIEPVSLSSKPLSLLAYLCASCPPRLHRRDTLIALLWPELDDAHARGALRQELYQLRRALGPGLIVGERDEAVGIDDEQLWCDVRAFDAALNGGRAADALALWRGEFLPGLHVNGGEFERWVDERRDQLTRRATTAARELSEQAERDGELSTAVAGARRLTELAPYDETAWQRLIVLLDRTGDRAGALTAYDSLKTRLRTELEVDPSPETSAIAEQIRNREAAFALPPPPEFATARQTVGKHAAPDMRPRWVLAAAVIVVAIGLALMVPSRTFNRVRSWSPAVIELMPTENRTGDPTLDAFARRVTDHLARGLIEPCFVTVVTGSDSKGVNGVVSATMYRRGDRVEIHARLSERKKGGPVLEMPAPVLLTPYSSDAALDTLTARLLSAVAAHYDPRSAGPNAPTPFRITSWQAYLEYLEGSELYGERQFADAARHLLKAYEIDPNFVKAAIFASIGLAYAGEPARADSLVTAATSGRALADYERVLSEWLLAVLHGRQQDAYRAGKELARNSRHPVLMLIAGREAMAMARPKEALHLGFEIGELGHGWWRSWSEIWETRGGAYHVLGDHHAELAELLEARRRFPESLEIFRAEVRARAALGEADQALKLVADALTLRAVPALSYPFGEITPAHVAWTAAQELDTHGRGNAARRARLLGLGWLRQQQAPTRQEKLLETRILLELGDARQAYGVLATLAPFNDLESLELGGLIAATLGGTAAASAAARTLETLQNEYLAGHNLLMAAGIHAALQRPDVAVVTLRRAFAAGLPFSTELHALPALQPLSARKDFASLLRPRG